MVKGPAAESGNQVHFGPTQCVAFEVGSSCKSMREASPAFVRSAAMTSSVERLTASPAIAARCQA
eukprot:4130076-Pyramimonas_sp.AAC.1